MTTRLSRCLLTGPLTACLMVTALVPTVHALSFNWSYTWATGTIAAGMIEGTEFPTNPNQIRVSSIMGGISTFPDVTFSNFASTVIPRDGQGMVVTIQDLTRFGNPLGLRGVITISSVGAGIARFGRGGETGPPIIFHERELFEPSRWIFNEKTDPIPEPGSLILTATGLLGLGGYRWHQRRARGLKSGKPPSAHRHLRDT